MFFLIFFTYLSQDLESNLWCDLDFIWNRISNGMIIGFYLKWIWNETGFEFYDFTKQKKRTGLRIISYMFLFLSFFPSSPSYSSSHISLPFLFPLPLPLILLPPHILLSLPLFHSSPPFSFSSPLRPILLSFFLFFVSLTLFLFLFLLSRLPLVLFFSYFSLSLFNGNIIQIVYYYIVFIINYYYYLNYYSPSLK